MYFIVTVKLLIERHGALFFNLSSIVAVDWQRRSNIGSWSIFQMARQKLWKIILSPITGEVNVAYILLSFSSRAILNHLDAVNLLTYL